MKKKPSIKTLLAGLASAPADSLIRHFREDPALIEDPASLVNASLHGRSDLVTFLLQHGADPNKIVPSHEKYRPLHRAIEHRGFPKNEGHAATVEILLQGGADPELRSTWMQLRALAVAGLKGDRDMIRLLREFNPRESIFEAAILADEKALNRHLRKKGAATLADENQMTPLHYSALSGLSSPEEQAALARIAAALCDAGADINASPRIGPYPSIPVLHFAAWGNNLAVAQTLLERGANPNLGFGNCLWRQPGELAELFLKHGADINGREPNGQPLLNSRIHWNLTSVVLWLLEKGADPNLRDSRGNTALHEAYQRQASPKIFAALKKHGAQETLKNQAGQRPGEMPKAK